MVSIRLPKQSPWVHLERLGEFFYNSDRRVASAPLDVADVGAVDASAIGIVFLAPALLGAEPPDVVPEALTYVHVGLVAPPSTIDLQTMRDI